MHHLRWDICDTLGQWQWQSKRDLRGRIALHLAFSTTSEPTYTRMLYPTRLNCFGLVVEMREFVYLLIWNIPT